jgi:DNA-binding transcriptional MerR regulator
MEKALPAIPAKRYFTIGEVSDLCGVKPHVLRYWEQEFTQLKPMKRRGNRRYYQHHEVLLIRRIRELLYEQGFTISGARNRLSETHGHRPHHDARADPALEGEPEVATLNGSAAHELVSGLHAGAGVDEASAPSATSATAAPPAPLSEDDLRAELRSIRKLLED